jgi:flagellar export protein FliJ
MWNWEKMHDEREEQGSVKRSEALMRAKRFRFDDLTRRLSTLDAMRADSERKLADLEESVARERQRANDSDIGRLAFPSFLRSIESRRENLKSTLKELERERESVQAALDLASQELKVLELAAEQQQKRLEELEARRAEARLEEMAIVRHLRKHALRSA